jgi:hypothetical protein
MSFGSKLSSLLNNHAGRFRIITTGCIVLAFVPFVVPIIFSQPVGQAYLQMIDRQMAKIAPPEFVFIGDSLTANANWRWMLSNNPFTAVNLAESGATINEVSAQLLKARAYHARFVAVGDSMLARQGPATDRSYEIQDNSQPPGHGWITDPR